MIISMHIGAHCTASSALMRGLLKNKGRLSEHGVVIPGPARYREILPEVMKKVKGAPASAETQEMILDQITEAENCTRLVMSHEDIICMPQGIFADGKLYAKAEFRLPWLRNVFAGHQIEFILGVRNPASFIPAAFAHGGGKHSYATFIGDADPDHLRWSRLITTMRQTCPDVPIKVYAFEDTPVIWGRLIREVAGVRGAVPLAGALDMIATLMKPEGITRLRSYLETHKPKNEVQFQRILGAFLDKYADPAQMEDEIDLPGWDDALVERLTATYEDDLYLIEGMRGVTLIS